MDFWTVVLLVVGVAIVFVVLPVAATAWSHWRRPMRLTCPRVGSRAQINVAATRAAVAAVFGRDPLGIEKCSLWSDVWGCRNECLALPHQALSPVRRGEPPPRPAHVHMIVVPLDGTAGSEEVLPIVGTLALAHRATVHLVHVLGPLETLRAEENDTKVVVFVDQEGERLERETREYFDGLRPRLAGVKVEGSVRFGDPLTQIVDVAEEVGAELIALATHHRGLLGRIVTRSLARRLGRATTIPLLLVPYGDRAATFTARTLRPGTVIATGSRARHIWECVEATEVGELVGGGAHGRRPSAWC